MTTPTTSTLIFLDIDGTLINRDQKTNDASLPQTIQRLTKQGIKFGLNSNRSKEDVEKIYKKFKLNGPLILENGVYYIEGKKQTMLAPQALHCNPALTKKLLTKFVESQKEKIVATMGDSTRLLQTKKINTIPALLLANKFRKYTGSIHVMRYGKRDILLAEKLARFLRSEFKKRKNSITVVRSVASGNVIFYPTQASKGAAIAKVRKRFHYKNIYMIGDDQNDIETLRYVNGFFAVGNALPAVKRHATYTARHPYTRGVSEILHHLFSLN